MYKKDVLIIGAGPAGLTAACKSLDRFSEYEFTVFEKSDCFSNILRPVRLRRRLCFVFRRAYESTISRITCSSARARQEFILRIHSSWSRALSSSVTPSALAS